jgi:hypothetical protein
VNYTPVDKNFLLPDQFSFNDLMDASIIFPYSVSKEHCCYTMPSVLFLSMQRASSDNPAIANHWAAIKVALQELVPGLRWQHLFPSFTTWWKASLNAYDLGRMWKDVLSASLAVCYYLHMQRLASADGWCKFSDMYKLSQQAQAWEAISPISVNFRQGVVRPAKEVDAKTRNLKDAVHLNCATHQARFDIVLRSQPAAVVVQAKNTLFEPTTAKIASQARGSHVLLWFYPGRDEDTDGAGCVSPLNMDFFILMKNLAAG